jgi:uncharacterized membrane-anchored protein
MNRRWLILGAVAVTVIQIGFLASMIAGRAAILRNGEVVTLEVRPIDPRDLLRGDYVILGYNITTIPTDLFEQRPDGTNWDDERPVHVRLRAGEDGIWQAVAARYGAPPEAVASEGDVDIRGIASAFWPDGATNVDVDYGIERFYVPEGEGRAIETDLRERPFRMKVAVDDNGAAQIKSFHDGEALLFAEPLY